MLFAFLFVVVVVVDLIIVCCHICAHRMVAGLIYCVVVGVVIDHTRCVVFDTFRINVISGVLDIELVVGMSCYLGAVLGIMSCLRRASSPRLAAGLGFVIVCYV